MVNSTQYLEHGLACGRAFRTRAGCAITPDLCCVGAEHSKGMVRLSWLNADYTYTTLCISGLQSRVGACGCALRTRARCAMTPDLCSVGCRLVSSRSPSRR